VTELILSEELTPLLRRFLGQRSPVEVSREGGAGRPPLWDVLAEEIEVTGLLVPERHGGQGASVVELAAVVHETGRVGWSGPLVATAGVSAHLLAALDPDDAAGLQAAVAEGRVVATALHEDPHGASLATTATLRDGRLDATRVHVDAGTHAETLLLLAADAGEPVLVAVEAGADGVEVRAQDAVDPGRGLATLTCTDAEAVVVARGDGVAPAVEDAWLLGGLLAAADAVGAAGRVLELARDYAVEREQFGRLIATFQSVKHTLVDMFAELETARSLLRHALEVTASGDGDWRTAASAAQARAGDAAMVVVREGVQVHGGIGFTWEHEVSHHFRRVTALRSLHGTPAVHRARVAARLGF
jgi:alkylation response protein AidB-like acyl-CoA dehydrogenase